MAARDHFRAYARRRVELGATLWIRDGGPRKEVRIRDIGLGGACVEIPMHEEGTQAKPSPVAAPSEEGRHEGRRASSTATAIDREVPVTIEVMAPTRWDPLILSGKIAWLKRGGQGRATRVGIRFEHREPSALFALFQLLGAHIYEA